MTHQEKVEALRTLDKMQEMADNLPSPNTPGASIIQLRNWLKEARRIVAAEQPTYKHETLSMLANYLEQNRSPSYVFSQSEGETLLRLVQDQMERQKPA